MRLRPLAFAAALGLALLPQLAQACACGCGVFDVGAGSQLTPGKSLVVSLEYDLLDQNMNWSGDGHAPRANNSADKRILTHYVKIDAEYLVNREWSVRVDIPIADRHFNTIDEGDGVALDKFHDTSPGRHPPSPQPTPAFRRT